jgi:hypothetical protein
MNQEQIEKIEIECTYPVYTKNPKGYSVDLNKFAKRIEAEVIQSLATTTDEGMVEWLEDWLEKFGHWWVETDFVPLGGITERARELYSHLVPIHAQQTRDAVSKERERCIGIVDQHIQDGEYEVEIEGTKVRGRSADLKYVWEQLRKALAQEKGE